MIQEAWASRRTGRRRRRRRSSLDLEAIAALQLLTPRGDELLDGALEDSGLSHGLLDAVRLDVQQQDDQEGEEEEEGEEDEAALEMEELALLEEEMAAMEALEAEERSREAYRSLPMPMV